MLPYSRGIILDNTNNYGIVKTETVFGFGPTNKDSFVEERFNRSEPLEWFITHGNFEARSLSGETESKTLNKKAIKTTTPAPQQKKNDKKVKSKKAKQSKGHKKRKGKVKKCIYKIIRKSEKKKNKGSNKMGKPKKYILPLILGLFAAKSLLIPVALKALAFLSAKGLMMGFFSTVMASVLSLKGMFDHSHGYANRKDDTKTQVEIIQVPAKTEDQHVYYDDHFKRTDLMPVKGEFLPLDRDLLPIHKYGNII
ncbi:uncharacterized protein LOC128680539 [Plodia interpunctella]|uniref:uncharacterized protein LOC128680539 n=1 Tax=Plodia interpunctella TaxID=58824 RepID=UPI0023682FE9|nr:uncharacterized protein LOC128680539 [Plodia interpunctella]